MLNGTYDAIADVFTPNSEAASLNTPTSEHAFKFHRSGLWATHDVNAAMPRLVARAALGMPWVDVGPLGMASLQSSFHPVLADYQGQVVLLYVLGPDIAMAPIDLNSGALTASPNIVVRTMYLGGRVVSPNPIYDGGGQLVGVAYGDMPTPFTTTQCIALDLDAATPGLILQAWPSYLAGGGLVGGRLIHQTTISGQARVMSIDAIWFAGARAPIGSTMRVTFYTPPTTASEQYFSVLMASDAFLTAGQPFRGISGVLGLNPGGLVTSSAVPHDNLSGSATLPFFIPNNPVLRGMRVPAQSVTLDGVRNRAWFGNTAWLAVE